MPHAPHFQAILLAILPTTCNWLLTRRVTPLPADVGAPLGPDERGSTRQHLPSWSGLGLGLGFVMGLGLVLVSGLDSAKGLPA